MLKIKIPATSANLGPGFDALGLALNMYNEVHMQEIEGCDIASLDDPVIPTGKDNMIYVNAKHLYNLCGRPFYGMKIRQINNIPMTRGLGSSSACIIGGLLGANALLGNPLQRQDILTLAADMEGHPDNIAPALLGGLVTSVMEDNKVWSISVPVSDNMRFAALIPDFEMSTEQARKILPHSVTRREAVFNLSRTALMTAALFSGELDCLKIAVDDKLHQPKRLELIPGGKDAMEICYELGAYGVYLSGAGPTIMAIIDSNAQDFAPIAKIMLEERGIYGWSIIMLECDQEGAKFID